MSLRDRLSKLFLVPITEYKITITNRNTDSQPYGGSYPYAWNVEGPDKDDHCKDVESSFELAQQRAESAARKMAQEKKKRRKLEEKCGMRKEGSTVTYALQVKS